MPGTRGEAAGAVKVGHPALAAVLERDAEVGGLLEALEHDLRLLREQGLLAEVKPAGGLPVEEAAKPGPMSAPARRTSGGSVRHWIASPCSLGGASPGSMVGLGHRRRW